MYPLTRKFGLPVIVTLILASLSAKADPVIGTISQAVEPHILNKEVAGAVTLVVRPDRVIHFEAQGYADLATQRPMATNMIFWIASMTKPLTACAIMMLQDQQRLSIHDPVAKHIPAFTNLKTDDGKEQTLTLWHLLTHTSGLAEPSLDEAIESSTLTALMPHIVDKSLLFKPGTRWQYSQSGMNTLGRIVEIVSGQPFEQLLQDHLFKPLDMTDTTFYPTASQQSRIAKTYTLSDGQLQESPIKAPYNYRDGRNRYPAANGGLYSTASDYGHFCQMLLNQGTYQGIQLLTPAAIEALSSIQTPELKTGFTEGMTWGLGCGVVKHPQGVTAMLSPGTFGHGGAYGTQAWVDPHLKIAYVLMVQRQNFKNGDQSSIRHDFQQAAHQAVIH